MKNTKYHQGHPNNNINITRIPPQKQNTKIIATTKNIIPKTPSANILISKSMIYFNMLFEHLFF